MKSLLFLGIDPGQKGGIAIIDNDGTIQLLIEMPVSPAHGIDSLSLYKQLTPLVLSNTHTTFCMIEKAQSMPKQGVKSMFVYGVGYGKLLSIMDILKINYQEIHPSIWKKEFSLTKKEKVDSCDVASKLFSGESFLTERGRLQDGKAEALLLSEYARRKYKGIPV